jgi:hypothetical protein
MLEPLLFDISGRAPISIRDQILRGRYLVHGLSRLKLLGPGSKLLVVGAGVAGVTTVLEALRRGDGDVILVDRKPIPFATQAQCTTRWIDPAQYDWPAPHFDRSRWPVASAHASSASVPMGFQAAPAAHIAGRWSNALAAQVASLRGRAASSRLSQHYAHELTHWQANLSAGGDVQGYNVTCRLVRSGSGSSWIWLDVDTIVLAYGVKAERTIVADPASPATTPQHGASSCVFEGRHFWANDPFQQLDFGLSGTGNVLVSGGGDGALQDFIRLTTGQDSARAVFEAAFSRVPQLRELLVSQLWHEDDQAHRALLWSVDKPSLHAILTRLHQAHTSAIREVRGSAAWAQIETALSQLTAGRNLARIQLAHPCDHFSPCYSLNRLIALLIGAYMVDRGLKPFLSMQQVVRVEHQGAGSCGVGCWDASHAVTFLDGASCSASGQVQTVSDYDGVVIRHGVERHDTAAGAMPAHSLPLHPIPMV